MIESQKLAIVANKEYKLNINELIKERLWKISHTYIITSEGLNEMKTFTIKKFKLMGISKSTVSFWRKNDFKSRNLIIIPNKDIMNRIPSIQTEIKNGMHYMSESEWDKIVSFKKSFNSSNRTIFSSIIGKKSNIPKDLVRNWVSRGKKPFIYPDIDFDGLLREMQNEDPLIDTKNFTVSLGLLFSCGNFGERRLNWTGPTIDSVIAFNEKLIPIHRGKKLTISSNNRGTINSINFKFIDFLQRIGSFTLANKKGKIFFDKEILNSFTKEIKEIFVSQMIATHLSVSFTKLNKCIELIIPCHGRNIIQIKMFIDLLEEIKILPAVAYIGSNGKSVKGKEILTHLMKKNLNVVSRFSQNDLDISLFYPPYGRNTYSDLEYKYRAETTQRLIEDIVIKSYLSKDVVTNIIKYSNYLENIYGTHYPTKDTTKFKEAIDDMGGINTFDLTRMEESFKSYRGYEYCLPVWAL